MTAFEELEVWAQFKNGDKRAFEAIYHRHYGALVNYGLRLKQDVNFVEEAVQDLFVKLWQNRDNLNRPASLKHYLLKSLRNIIYNKLNAVSREFYVGDETDMLGFEFHIPRDSADYHQQLLKKLMAELTDRQKEAVYLFYQEELSYQEISDVLKIKIGGTYKLIYRALEKMKSGFHRQVTSSKEGLADPAIMQKTSS